MEFSNIKIAYAVVIVIVLVLAYYYFFMKLPITGMYVNDPNSEFTKKSKIKMMMFYIGEPDYGLLDVCYKCHLLIDDKFNNYLTIKMSRFLTNSSQLTKNVTITYDDDDESPESRNGPWSGGAVIKFDIRTGRLSVIGKDDGGEKIVYAKLYRDNILSI